MAFCLCLLMEEKHLTIPVPLGEIRKELKYKAFPPISIQARCTGNEHTVVFKCDIVLLCAEVPHDLTGIPCISGDYKDKYETYSHSLQNKQQTSLFPALLASILPPWPQLRTVNLVKYFHFHTLIFVQLLKFSWTSSRKTIHNAFTSSSPS